MASLTVNNGRLLYQNTVVPITVKSQLGCFDSVVSRCLGGWKDLTTDECEIVYVRLRQLRSFLGNLLNEIDPKLYNHALFTTAVKVYMSIKLKMQIDEKDIKDLLDLQLSEKMILSLVKHDVSVLNHLPVEMMQHEATLLEMIQTNHLVFSFVPDEFKRREDFIIKAVLKNHQVYELLGERHQTSNSILTLVLTKDPAYFNRLPDHLKNDREKLGDFLEISDGIVYTQFSEELKASREFAAFAVAKNGLVIRYFSKNFRNDSTLALAAVKQNPAAYEFVGGKCKMNDRVIIEAIRKDEEIFLTLPERKKYDESLIYESLKVNYEVFNHLPNHFKNNVRFIKYVLSLNGKIYGLLPDNLKSDKVCVCIAFDHDPEILEVVNEQLLEDVKLLKVLYLINPVAMGKYLDSKLALEHLYVRNLAMDKFEYKGLVLSLIATLINHEAKDFCMSIYCKSIKLPNYLGNLELLVGSRRCAGVSIMLFCALDLTILPEAFYLKYGKTFDVFLQTHRPELLKFNNEFCVAFLLFLQAVIRSPVEKERKIEFLNRVCQKAYVNIVEELHLITALLNMNNFEKLEKSSLSSDHLKEIFMWSCVDIGVLKEDQVENFDANFLSSRKPSAIFLLVSKFWQNREMKRDLKKFISSVVEGNFKERRMEPNTQHFQSLSSELLVRWKEPTSQLFIFPDESRIILEESDDWEDLLLFGTDVQYPCFNLEENHVASKAIFSFLLDGKYKLLLIRGTNKGVFAGAIVRLLVDSQNKPVMFLDKTLPLSSNYSPYILEFAKHVAEVKQLPLYIAGDQELMHSLDSKACFEYSQEEDALSKYGYAIWASSADSTPNLPVGTNTEV